jgi:DNA-directed RNA polymerase beta' subunit
MIYHHESQYLHIGLASPDQIRSWSERILPSGDLVGLVTKPYTIHYQTYKPEPDGLFCEKIFGPIKTGFCACGKYQGIVNLKYSQCCEQCGVEITESKVRRYNMGYISLQCPVVHIWYLKSVPSLLARVLNQPMEDLESIVYYDV